jgi:hypothetical protein
MLKIVYPICHGIDVHKSFLVACIASTNEKGVTSYKSICKQASKIEKKNARKMQKTLLKWYLKTVSRVFLF